MFDLIFTLFVFGVLLVCERYTHKYATLDQRAAVRAAFARVRNMLRYTAAFQILWGLFVVIGSVYWPEHVSLPDKFSTLLLPGHFAVAILSYLFGIADGVRRSVPVPRDPGEGESGAVTGDEPAR